ncbi:UNVERIFIED_CONTAM: hypothetical protein FKN15_048431 [Acipenser sinensis]
MSHTRSSQCFTGHLQIMRKGIGIAIWCFSRNELQFTHTQLHAYNVPRVFVFFILQCRVLHALYVV